MDGITYRDRFLDHPEDLFRYLETQIAWDERMAARKTASFGVAYNYSQVHYPFQPMPPALASVCDALERTLGFRPNNCLLNYYRDGRSKMGYHSDQTDILAPDTGVAIVSLGECRTLRFRNIADPTLTHDVPLPAGSLLYMTQRVQHEWQHAIPRTDTDQGRISLTFRRMQPE
ncbi:2OG-Fe(II) oxygenase superfamily protein [Catalinimonas alkaloidigena]|uniref:2OG-Fe(II) oxygenase superfamily protein n=1 Tax=Catalinimonas alkaloidigena TaxID=1075417 RepID=A0A1G9G976_9BACT|nr:alpha-ketoglutarate-dependent dioxygenase AlkB [Catalinimonas alkaloidigena]SDK97091.1 2OG-Fe(II) oxygenase superfamily protein [Catalinimonas alkaloidigena]